MHASMIQTSKSNFISRHILRYLTNIYKLPHACRRGIALSFAGSALSSIYYFLSIYFVNVLGMNASTAGLLISTYGVGTIIGGFAGGQLADKFATRLIPPISLSGQAVAIILLSQLTSPLSIAADLFLLGIMSYCFITANYTEVLSHCTYDESARLRAINILNIASNLGIGIAALSYGVLAAHSYKNIFYFSGTMLLILSCILFLRSTSSHLHTQTKNIASQTIDIKINDNSRSTSKTKLKLALLCLFFIGMIVSQLGTTYSIYLEKHLPQLGIHAFTAFFTLNTILIVIFQNALVTLFANKNKLIMIGIGSFLIGGGMYLLNFIDPVSMVILSCFLYSTGEMIFFSMVQLYCYQAGGKNRKGRSLGTYRSVYAASRLIGPAAGGSIYYYLGSTQLWNVCGFMGVFFLLVCFGSVRYSSNT